MTDAINQAAVSAIQAIILCAFLGGSIGVAIFIGGVIYEVFGAYRTRSRNADSGDAAGADKPPANKLGNA